MPRTIFTNSAELMGESGVDDDGDGDNMGEGEGGTSPLTLTYSGSVKLVLALMALAELLPLPPALTIVLELLFTAVAISKLGFGEL